MNYNESTINANIKVEELQNRLNNGNSLWKVTVEDHIMLDSTRDLIMPAGMTFEMAAEEDATADEVYEYIRARGIVDACDLDESSLECQCRAMCEELGLDEEGC